MSLDIVTKDLQLGTGGLNLKIDPTMLPPNQLSRADNVAYGTDGVLSQRRGHTVVSGLNASYDKTKGTALFPTREGNVGYVQQNGAGRNLGSFVGAHSLQPTYGAIAQIPAGTDAVTLLPTVPQNIATCATSVAGRIAMAWDYDVDATNTLGTQLHKRQVWWAVWDTATSTWIVTPRQLVLPTLFTADIGVGTVVGAAQPMVFCSSSVAPLGFIAASIQFTNGANTYTQIGTVQIDVSTGVNTVTINKVTSTQQGPLAGGVYTLPSVCPLPVPPATNVAAFVWSPLDGVSTSAQVVALVASSGSGGARLTPAGTIGQTRPVTACWYDGTSYSTILVSDSANFATVTVSAGPALAAAVGPVANGLGGGTVQGQLICGRNSATNSTYIVYGTKVATGTGTGVPTVANTAFINSPITWGYITQVFVGPGNQPCAWLCYNGNLAASLQNTLLCVALPNCSIIGRAAYLSANKKNRVPQPVLGQVGDGGVYPSTFAFLSEGALYTDGGALSPSVNLSSTIATPQVTLLKASWGATQTVELPNGTLTSGLAPAFLTEKDGFDLGFSWFPEIDATGFSNFAGGNVIGTVQYMLAYRWVDGYNQVHWSAPSAPVSYLVGAVGQIVQLPIATTNYTPYLGKYSTIAPGSGAIPYWFRTKNGGSTFYQLGPAGNFDNTPDSQLSGQFLAYTEGGEVANDPPPPASLVATTTLRAYAVSAENPTQLFYSKPFRVGHPVEWSAQQYLYVAPHTGAITAMGVMDDKLIIFKAGSVYLLSGDNGSLLTPQFYGPVPVAAMSGCSNPQSVITTDAGMFYQSAQGIQLLQRNLTTQFVGQNLGGAVGNITGAAVLPISAHVRFLDIPSGCVWVFDDTVNRWSKFTYRDSGSTFALPSYALLATNAVGTYLVTDQGPLMESSTYLDGARQVFPVVESGHIAMSSIHQGFGRLRRITFSSTSKTGANTLAPTVQLGYDYSATYTDTLAPTATTTPAGEPLPFRSRAPRQKVQAVRFLITWPNVVSANEQMSLTGLSLEIAIKQGVYKFPAAQSV